ncbi:MAG: hypothetical protein ABS46_11365 [Cytophagaceae bacterium SCN 52-12]|nr:MAG: hypothetical protein ABS46_11365 [Cytophagaceae bacterium SCN 52-12]
MGENKLRSFYLYTLFAVLWGYCFFSGVISPPFLSYYTFDESFIVDSGVFLWYGITPRILDWPASPSVLMYGVIFGCSVFYDLVARFSELTGFLDAFVVMDKAAYAYLFDREPYLLAGRAVQLLVVLWVMILTLRFLFRREHPLLAGPGRYCVALLLVSSHLVLNNATVIRPEAISAVFFIYILCRLLFSEQLGRSEVITLSVLFGLVAAERLIFLFMTPLFFAGIFLLSGKDGRKAVRISLGIFLLAFLAFCPFVLTDPLIISKAFFGGILAKVNDSPMGSFFNWKFIKTYFDNPAGYLALPLTFLGLYRLWESRNLFYRIVAANWLLFLFLVLRSSKIYDPHVLPAALINLLLMGIGLKKLADLAGPKREYLVWMAGITVVVGEAAMIAGYHTWVRRDTNEYEAIRWIRKEIPGDSKLLVNMGVGLFLAPNDAALERRIAATDNADNQLRKLGYLMGLNQVSKSRLNAEEMPLSASAFAFEDESLFGLQYRLLRKYGKMEERKRFDADIYVDDNTLFYHGILLPEALDRFQNGEYQYMVTGEALGGKTPVKEFTGRDDGPIRIYKASPRSE